MNAAIAKLADLGTAFAHPVTTAITALAAGVLILAPVLFEVFFRTGRIEAPLRKEMYTRYFSWLVIAPLMLGPILIGPGCTILAVAALSLLCYREFARATGFFRDRLGSAIVTLGIVTACFAVYDHWYGFFVALPSLTIAAIAIGALAADEPKGYIQRVAIATLCFLLFGVCFGHLAYFANDADYRPILMTILLCVALNDVFAFAAGKSFGRRRLAPNTSPNKTIGGAIGALVLTTTLFAVVGHFTFDGPLAAPGHLIAMGMLLSSVGQFGDLVMSSVKRDLGVKDMGAAIPGHGGLLDRFDSLLLVAPALFHYIGYFRGIGLDEPVRIITGP